MGQTIISNAAAATSIPAVDLDRAKRFYGETLGLETSPMPLPEGSAMFMAGEGTRIFLYEREGTKAEHTAIMFSVADFDGAIDELRSLGVVLEDYDQPGLKTVNGIADMGGSKTAWFKDSEGNILNIFES